MVPNISTASLLLIYGLNEEPFVMSDKKAAFTYAD